MLGWKRGARPYPQQHHPVPQGCTSPTKCQLTTRSPQEACKQSHKNHTAPKMHTTPSRLFCHTTHARAHLISCVGKATPSPHNHTNPTPSLPFFQPCSAPNHTAVVSLINWHGLTFDLLPHPQKWVMRKKGYTRSGTQPPIATNPLCAPIVKRLTGRTLPPERNKTCVNTHTHIAHRAWSMLTSLIEQKKLFPSYCAN